MTPGFRLLPAGIEEGQFKRVAEGWLFTSANPWVFGRRRTYLLNDAQKPAIAARVRRARFVRPLVLLPMMLVMATVLIMAPTLLASPSLMTWLILGGFVAAATFAITMADHLMVRSLLRDVPRTSQKISIGEMTRNQGAAMSAKALAIFTFIFVLAAAGNAYRFLTITHGAALAAVAAVLMLVLAITFGAMLVGKLRATRTSP